MTSIETILKVVIVTLGLLVVATFVYADDISILETLIWEASNQSSDGMIAVARVIRNRMHERGLTALEVVKEPYQFSCWNHLDKAKERIYQKWELQRAEQAWEMSKYYTDFKANLYHHRNVSPYWSRSKKVEFIEQIGDHKFYYERSGA